LVEGLTAIFVAGLLVVTLALTAVVPLVATTEAFFTILVGVAAFDRAAALVLEAVIVLFDLEEAIKSPN
jgi:uncharacterized membrane protein YkgB